MHEKNQRSKYSHTLMIKGTEATMKFRVSRPYSGGHCTDAVIKTEVFGWISVGQRCFGAPGAQRYDPNGCATNDEFCNVMDANDADEDVLAEVVCNTWRH